MYTPPVHPESLRKWREAWTDYFLSFVQERNIHLISITDLRREFPFADLDPEALQDIINSLVERRRLRWWDKGKHIARVYWRTLDEWAYHISGVAKEKEKRVIDGVRGLIELEPLITGMPIEEIEQILNIMVKNGFARWIDKKQRTARIIP